MFVVSVSSKRFKKIALCLGLVIALAGGILIYVCSLRAENNADNISITNNIVDGSEGLLDFISSYGWEVVREPEDVREVIIPVEFDDVYTNYNSIQTAQGYNLEKYAGERVKKWTFTVLNYPQYENRDCIKINLLVFEGKVIGGDVCSVELDGFMHGFALEKD